MLFILIKFYIIFMIITTDYLEEDGLQKIDLEPWLADLIYSDVL